MADKKTIASWILSILTGIAFLGAGASKVTQQQAIIDNLHGALGVPLWAIPVIGSFEILGAILLIIPKTRFWGGKLLTTIMVGAVITHLINADFVGFIPPLVLGTLAGTVAWIERPEWAEKWFPRKA